MPVFRKLRHFTGTFEEVKTKINELPVSTGEKDLCEIDIVENRFIPGLSVDVQDYVESMKKVEIVKFTIKYIGTTKGADELFESSISIKDLSDIQVFEKLLDAEHIENRDEILQTYISIKQIISQNENI